MPAKSSFDYAIVRIVPHVDREEFINVGVILFCRTQRFLDARIALDNARLLIAGVVQDEGNHALGDLLDRLVELGFTRVALPDLGHEGVQRQVVIHQGYQPVEKVSSLGNPHMALQCLTS